MSIEIIYYVHGTTIDNESGLSTGWNQGELSGIGLEQTIKAAEETRLIEFDAIFCSDLYRAKQSAEILFDIKKNSIIYDKRLRECNYGKLNGKPSEQVNYLHHISDPFEEGESLLDVEKRMRMLIDDLKEKYDFKKIAIISHRAPQLALEVCTNNINWTYAIEHDWRECGKWQLGWQYIIN